jgi:uncharacterized protein (DUF305 family)
MSRPLMCAIAALLCATAAQAQKAPPNSAAQMHHADMVADRQMPGENGGETSMGAMHDRMMGAAHGGPDESFHRQMIEHHRGGVMMAKMVLKRSRDRQTIDLAKRIIRDQQREIDQMQTWLRRHHMTSQ